MLRPVLQRFSTSHRQLQQFKKIRSSSSSSSNPPSTPPSPLEARAARKAKAKQASGVSRGLLASLGIGGLIGYGVYDITQNPQGTLGTQYEGSWLQKTLNQIYQQTLGRFDEIFEPSSDKLLPDWGNPTFYPGVPPGSPAPPLLVVDLEKTLIGSTYDSKHGWRHVKRPGLDKFIRELSNYYEIVLFSENDIGVVTEILLNIDPEGRCHKLGSNAGEMRGNQVLKRLDFMNRDLRRIILIDDDPNAFQLFPRNTIQIKPYNNVNDTTDTILYQLIPLLQAFVHEDARDFRDTIDNLGTHDAQECVTEYEMRLYKAKQQEQERRSKGLGGLIRGTKEKVDDDLLLPRSSILSPKDIVGGAPGESITAKSFIPVANFGKKEEKGPVQKKKGALFSYLDQMEKDKEEQEMKKREVMLRIQNERLAAQQQQQQQEQQS